MSLKSTNKIETNTYELEIEASAEEFEAAVQAAYLKAKNKINRLRRTVLLPVLQDAEVIPQNPKTVTFGFRLRLSALQPRQNGRLLLGNAKILCQSLGSFRWRQVKKPRHKVDHVTSCSAAEAVKVILIQLHAGRMVIVEGAADHIAAPDFQAVVFGSFFYGNCRLDLCK